MARLTPLVPLFSPSEQLEVSAVAEKLESWLRGNTVPVGHEWHGVREVKAGQMGTATWELCRLIRNKVSVSDHFARIMFGSFPLTSRIDLQ